MRGRMRGRVRGQVRGQVLVLRRRPRPPPRILRKWRASGRWAREQRGARLAGSPAQSARLRVSPRLSRPSVASWVPQELAPQGGGAELGGGQVRGSGACLSRAGRAGPGGPGGRSEGGSELDVSGTGLWAREGARRGSCSAGNLRSRVREPAAPRGASGDKVTPSACPVGPLSRRPPPLGRGAPEVVWPRPRLRSGSRASRGHSAPRTPLGAPGSPRLVVLPALPGASGLTRVRLWREGFATFP